MPPQRKRITLKGVKPILKQEMSFENFWVFGAICPADGTVLRYREPKNTAEEFSRFLALIAASRPNILNVVIVDNARMHTAKTLVIPKNIILVFLPPYSPELNPVERYWEHHKGKIKSGDYKDLEKIYADFESNANAMTTKQIMSLTLYPYIDEYVNR
jgi:transposase